jgi:hypothetical protein
VKTGHAWTQNRLHLGNRRKNPRDRISHASSRLRKPGKKAGKDGSHRRKSRVNMVFVEKGCAAEPAHPSIQHYLK